MIQYIPLCFASSFAKCLISDMSGEFEYCNLLVDLPTCMYDFISIKCASERFIISAYSGISFSSALYSLIKVNRSTVLVSSSASISKLVFHLSQASLYFGLLTRVKVSKFGAFVDRYN